MYVNVKTVDNGWSALQKALRDLRLSDKSSVSVGLISNKGGNETHAGSKKSVLEIGLIHEFGAPSQNIPERSFLRATFEQKADEWSDFLTAHLWGALASREDVGRVLDLVGAKAASDVKAFIRAGLQPGLSKRTLAIRKKHITTDAQGRLRYRGAKFASVKGFKPLIDTGQLLRAITWVRRLVGVR